MESYDLIVIGGGPAGYHGAAKAAAAGLSTCLIEKNAIGGTCLNEGCIPSKTLLASSKIVATARHAAAFGVRISEASLDMAALQARKTAVVDQLRKGIAFTLKKAGVTVVAGTAVVDGKEGDLFRVLVEGEVLRARRLLLCAGSVAARPPIPGIDQDFVWNNREALAADAIPASLVVIGAGVIGLELATFFAEAGSAVTVVEILAEPAAGLLDRDLAAVLRRELEKSGVTFLFETRVAAIGDHSVSIETSGGPQDIPAEAVLLATGRRAAGADLGLASIGLAAERGIVKTDACGRTGIADVWAAGDVNATLMLAHTAYAEAEAAVADMQGIDAPVNYSIIPSVIYTHPEIAWVGHTVESATAAGFDPEARKMPLPSNGRYLAETAGERGICKVVVDKQTDKILGVHIAGLYAAELIGLGGLAIANNLSAGDFARTVFAHPSVGESLRDLFAAH